MEGNKFVKHGNSANASRRVLVLMLSIMLVVSSISSSFAASSKATKEGDVKTSSFMKKTVREPKLCTVSFSAFGADNVPEPVKVPKGEKLGSNYPKEVPTKNGYICIGWTDGIFSMNEPNVDENYVVNNNMTLYAVWRSIINVTFNSNGGTGNMDAAQVAKGSDYVLPACGFTAPSGKEFDKWSVKIGSEAPVEKAVGESIVADANVMIKAIWKDKKTDFPLNATGNVNAKLDSDKNLIITATDVSKDMKIDREKWKEMVKSLGGETGGNDINWENADVKDLKFQTDGIYLPSDGSRLFSHFKESIDGSEKLKTDDVVDMAEAAAESSKSSGLRVATPAGP